MEALSYRQNISEYNNLLDFEICKRLIKQNNRGLVNLNKPTNPSTVYKIDSKQCGSVILKIFKNGYSYSKMFANEVKAMESVLKLINDNICPNFIYLYDTIRRDNLQIIMEYADGHTGFLFRETGISDNVYMTYMFQVLVGIMCLNHILKIRHKDIKPKNIFWKNVDPDIVLHYVINGTNYYVPTYGYLFMIADFGIAQELYEVDSHNNLDCKDFIKYLSYVIKDNMIEKYDTVDKFMQHVGPTVGKILTEKFDIGKVDILRYIISYCIQNDLISYDEFIVNPMIKKMYDVFGQTQPIESTLAEYFNLFTERIDTPYTFTISFDT